MSDFINLNDSSFDGKDLKIFNKGVAGIVENVALRAEVKKADDKPGSPNLKIFFIDPEGGEVNIGLWNIDPSGTDPDAQLTTLGRTSKHILHTLFGKEFQIPPFHTDVELIAFVKNSIDKSSSMRFRVAVNYGSEGYPKSYLTVKKFVPFMENMLIPKEDSKLTLGSKDLLRKPAADQPTATAEAPKDSWSTTNTDAPVF